MVYSTTVGAYQVSLALVDANPNQVCFFAKVSFAKPWYVFCDLSDIGKQNVRHSLGTDSDIKNPMVGVSKEAGKLESFANTIALGIRNKKGGI